MVERSDTTGSIRIVNHTPAGYASRWPPSRASIEITLVVFDAGFLQKPDELITKDFVAVVLFLPGDVFLYELRPVVSLCSTIGYKLKILRIEDAVKVDATLQQ